MIVYALIAVVSASVGCLVAMILMAGSSRVCGCCLMALENDDRPPEIN